MRATVYDHGSIVLVGPHDSATEEWLHAAVEPDAQWYNGALVVEPRYIDWLVEGMIEAGIELKHWRDE